MESSLLRQGLLPTATLPPPIQISSWHLAARNGAPEWLTVNNGEYQDPSGGHNWGGYDWMAMGYVTRGRGDWAVPGAVAGSSVERMGGGVVLNRSSPLNNYPLETIADSDPLGPVLPAVSQQVAFQTRSVRFYEQATEGRTQAQQLTAVKQAITTYGSVTTSMYVDNALFQTDGTTGFTTYRYTDGTSSNHSVAVIGWDDNFVVPGATAPGAFLIQNSWGTDWTPNGTGLFYASYEDTVIGRSGVVAYELAAMGNSSEYVLQNELGPTEQSGTTSQIMGLEILDSALTGGTNDAASVLSIVDATTVTAIGFAAQTAGVEAELRFYSAWGANGPENLLGDSLFVSFDAVGYRLFDLSAPLALAAGSQLVVVVDFEDGAQSLISYTGAYDTNPVADGLSYYFTGSEWVDFSGLGDDAGVFFLKGIVMVPEPGTIVLLLAGGALVLVFRRRLRATA